MCLCAWVFVQCVKADEDGGEYVCVQASVCKGGLECEWVCVYTSVCESDEGVCVCTCEGGMCE